MSNITKKNRLDNFLILAGNYRFKKDFCEKIDISPSQYSQIIYGNKRNIGDRLAAQIETALELPPGYLDTDHSEIEHNRRQSDDTSVISAILDSMPPHIKESLTRLIYSIASEVTGSN